MENDRFETENPYAAPNYCSVPSALSGAQIRGREKLREMFSRTVLAGCLALFAVDTHNEMTDRKTPVNYNKIVTEVIAGMATFTGLMIWQAMESIKDERRRVS